MMSLDIFLLLSIIPLTWAADNVKTIKLCENSVAPVLISPKGTVLDFPGDPEKVVLGTKNSFSIEYIKNDLAISPATVNSRANLFAYMQGRRFALELSTSAAAPTLYFIKDCQDQKLTEQKHGK